MHKRAIIKSSGILLISLMATACSLPFLGRTVEDKTVPVYYHDTLREARNSANIKWRDFFKDPNLTQLIDSALKRNQELNIMIQEINRAQTEVRARKGAYLPSVNLGAMAGVDQSSRYTRQGAVDATDPIDNNKAIPSPLPDYAVLAGVSWQVDIWKQLRNARKSAVLKYLATSEGKNFMVTHLVAEVATAYYELMALDNQLEILRQTIAIQQSALNIMVLQKKAGRVTELAVRRFQAEVNKNQSNQYYISQHIIEVENRINFLVGRFPQPVLRNSKNFPDLQPEITYVGTPAELLEHRPDIRQAELNLLSAKLDVKVAKANFYPALNIFGNVGLEAFKPSYLFSQQKSSMYTMSGGLIAPLINRNLIKAIYVNSSAKQIQAVYNYERAMLNGYIEVVNQVSNISNLEKSYELKTRQVAALTASIDISLGLFKTAMADYVEVLFTQRDALSARFELIETKRQRLTAMVNIYQALGGGWN